MYSGQDMNRYNVKAWPQKICSYLASAQVPGECSFVCLLRKNKNMRNVADMQG